MTLDEIVREYDRRTKKYCVAYKPEALKQRLLKALAYSHATRTKANEEAGTSHLRMVTPYPMVSVMDVLHNPENVVFTMVYPHNNSPCSLTNKKELKLFEAELFRLRMTSL